MHVRFEKKPVLAAAFALLAALAQFYVGQELGASLRVNLTASLMMAAAAGAAAGVRVELKAWWSAALMQVCAAFVGIYLLHFALLYGVNLPRAVFVSNYLLSLGILLALTALTGRPRAVSAFWLVLCFGYGMVNCAVAQFRGNMIAVGDILSVGTALSVAGSYRLKLEPRMIAELSVLLISLTAVLRSRSRGNRMRSFRRRALLLALAAAAAWTPVVNLRDAVPYTWGREGAYFNGVLMQFFAEAKAMNVSAPEGYSPGAVRQLVDQWPAEQAAVASEESPHVIAVMVEALSDLSVLGGFETSEEVMPVWRSLEQESIHGYALTSVLGGGTSNSEWEFLTGGSMALMPKGSNAYRQYVRRSARGLAELFGGRGYTCVAMHPYFASGWDRNRIYPLMGFDETYFIDDLEWGETVRGRVSDSAFVDQVIARFEGLSEREKLFLFGVTMQNHSDYDFLDFEATVRAVGLEGEYAEVDQYLSLIRLTDEAVGELIDYFRSVDEPVAVVIFGDHQPSLDDAFYAEIGADAQQDRYKVPWMIWKNYDSMPAELPLTSLNYLPAILLESIGAETPSYFSFLNDARKIIPALNSRGCVIDGRNIDVDELQGEAADVIRNYRIFQYANVFDEEVHALLDG